MWFLLIAVLFRTTLIFFDFISILPLLEQSFISAQVRLFSNRRTIVIHCLCCYSCLFLLLFFIKVYLDLNRGHLFLRHFGNVWRSISFGINKSRVFKCMFSCTKGEDFLSQATRKTTLRFLIDACYFLYSLWYSFRSSLIFTAIFSFLKGRLQ